MSNAEMSPPGGARVTAAADEFLLLHEFPIAARRKLARQHWDYLTGGAESETTLKRNRQALDSIAFRPRVLRDVVDVDLGATLLGMNLRIPIVLAPIGALQDLEPGGGTTAALAAGEFGISSMLSSASSPGLEEVAAATEHPKIFQLYVRGDAAWVDAHVERAIAAGYRAFCLTVDLDRYSRRERDIAKRHITTGRRDVSGERHQARFSWADVERLKARHDIPFIIKGIATAEDAAIACDHGIEVVYVSNHGGRQLDHGRGAIDVLPEVVKAVGGRAEIMIDGGFARGTDVVKAIALGANAVGIGRLYGYAIAAAGQAGVVRMLELLEKEMENCLALLGVTDLSGLDGTCLHPSAPVGDSHALSAFPLLEEDY